jgi:magnesium-transporting ATPase (P-type)
VIGIARGGRALGVVALGDTLRPDAVQAVTALRNAGLKTILVTGDNERAARRVAREVGIQEVHAGVTDPRRAEPAHTKAGELVATGRRKAPLRSLSFESAARFTAGRFFRALHFDFCRRDGASTFS